MNVLPWRDPVRAETLQRLLRERILVIDGAMGTMIQQHALDEAAYRGERFAHGYDHAYDRVDHEHGADCGCTRDQRGNNDLLSLTQPQLIRDIHAQYLAAGADLIETNTFNSTTTSLGDYGLEHLARELNQAGARLAREACDEAEARDPVASAFRDRRARTDQPDRFAESGREPAGLSRDLLR